MSKEKYTNIEITEFKLAERLGELLHLPALELRKCPICNKNMYQLENKWRCYYCSED